MADGETPPERVGAAEDTGTGYDPAEQVSRVRGAVFNGVTLLSTMFGIVMVAILLGYVAVDAFEPFSADPGWHLVFLLTLVVPSLGLLGRFYRSNRAAVTVAYESLGVPVVGLLGGGGLVVLFVEIIAPADWFGFVAALAVAGGAVYAHRYSRPEAALERLFVLVFAPPVAVFGVGPYGLDFTATTPITGTKLLTVDTTVPALLPSVGELVVPWLGGIDGWLLLVPSVTVPVALVFGRVVTHRRDDDRGVRETVVASVVIVTASALVSPAVGVNAENWVPLASATLVPAGAYLEGVFRRTRGRLGLAVPVVVVVGTLVGAALVRTLGFAGPTTWADWGFLTDANDRFMPREAGFYPPLVGSVLMLVVIMTSAFPLGVGAAIYLEEYAPDSGWRGRLVELIEINIGNLAGVPSVVYGLLGLAVFIRGVGFDSGIVVVGGFTVGLLILPIVIISAQEAIRAVPDSTRQASYGMGATRWQTVRNVVLPEALPGILTGTILALGRAIGETAPLLMIGAASSVRLPPEGFFARFSAMPRQIFSWRSEIQAEFRFGVLAAGVVVLVGVLLIMNGAAIVLRNRYQAEG